MAELGIIASVVGVASAALKSSQALIEMVDQVRNGPEELSAISRDAHSFHDIVTSVQLAIRDPTVIRVLQGDQKLFELVGRLEGPLQNCALVLTQLKPRLQPHFKASGDGGLRVSNVDLRWMFKKKDILDCRNRLEATKSTLDAALTSVVFFCSLRSAGQDVYKLPDTPPYTTSRDTDAGSILKEYAESVAPHSPPLNASSVQGNLHSDFPAEDLSDNLPLPLAAASAPWLKSYDGSAKGPYTSALRPYKAPEPLDFGGTATENSPMYTYDEIIDAISRIPDYFIALDTKDIKAIQRLVEAGLDPNKRYSDGRTALHLAALEGSEDLARTLIEKNADVDASTSETQSTPLHYAAQSGHIHIVKLLLGHDACIDLGDSFGETALHNSLRADHDDIAILLIHHGSPLFQPDHRGRIPLHFACSANSVQIVDVMLERLQGKKAKSKIDAKDIDGLTPLHLAATDGYREIAKRLLKAGADIDSRSTKGNTPLMAAARNGQLEIAKLLFVCGAALNITNFDGLDYEQIFEKHHPAKYEAYGQLLRAEGLIV